MWNIVEYVTGHDLEAMPDERFTRTGWRSYMRQVISASRLLRKTGAVPVLGLTRAKSFAESGKQRL